MPESRFPPPPNGAATPPLKDQRVLVAVENCERLERILAGHRLTIVRNVAEAERELQAREYQMAILGVMFDESRMFELLRLVRTFKINSATPVVCVLSGPATCRGWRSRVSITRSRRCWRMRS